MKKMLKLFSVGIAVLCFSFMLVGCGGGEPAFIDVSGDYKNVENEAQIEHLATAFDEVVENYEFKMDVKMTSEGATSDVSFSGIKDSSGNILFDVNMAVTTSGQSFTYKGQTYYDASQNLYYENLNGEISSSEYGQGQYDMINTTVSIDYIKTTVLEGLVEDFTQLEIAIKDGKTKLRFIGTQDIGSQIIDTEFYMIFNQNNGFEAFKITAKDESGSADTKAEFKLTDKKIEVPSFVS